MRLPLTVPLDTRDGVSAKNARLTNCLKESKKTGDKAVVRPGLVLDAQASGVGNGLVVFNNELVSVYGATLGVGLIDLDLSGVFAPSVTAGMRYVQQVVHHGSSWYAFCDTTDSFGVDYGIWQSTDMVTWTEVGSSLDFYCGRVVLVGTELIASGSFYDYDTDEETFVKLTISDAGVVSYTGITPSGARIYKYVAPYYYGPRWRSGTYYATRSLDLETVESEGDALGYSTTLGWNQTLFNGKFWATASRAVPFAGDEVFYWQSSDGLTWESKVDFGNGDNSSSISGVPTSFGMFVYTLLDDATVVIPRLYHSTDGVTFSLRAENFILRPSDSYLPESVMWESDGDLFIMEPASDTGLIPIQLWVSTDSGYTWESVTIPETLYTYFGRFNSTPVIDDGLVAFPFTEYGTYFNGVMAIGISAAFREVTPIATITGDFYDFAQSPL